MPPAGAESEPAKQSRTLVKYLLNFQIVERVYRVEVPTERTEFKKIYGKTSLVQPQSFFLQAELDL